MSGIRLDGRALAQQMREEMAVQVTQMRERGKEPHLAVILVGEDAASQIYVRNKERGCEQVGIRSTVMRMPADTTQEALETAVRQLNDRADVHGILVQLPLPKHIQESAVLELIAPNKDVDGFHPWNTGHLFSGQPRMISCTPLGAMEMIERAGISVAGKEAVVVGRSNIVGKPMAMLLLAKNATVTLCHSRTQDLAAHTRRADILVAAIGKANFITADMIKPGAVVIDVGINRVDGKVVGDVDFEAAKDVAGYITPVPGGVGQMTITMLLHNTLQALKLQEGI